MSSGGDTNVLSVISTDGSTSWQIVVALLASSVGFIVAIVNSIAAYFRDKAQMREIEEQDRRLKAFQKELEDKQRRLVRFENVQDLMKQYKKPLLQSAFDLQSRLANQINTNFLYTFAQKGVERDLQYAKLNMAYVISEFLGWLEVIRQEIVFIVGVGNDTTDLNLLIDAIKYQFTGEADVQGNAKPPKGEEHWKVLQLYAGELRAIGEVMILERTYEDRSMLSVIGYAEFVRRQTRALKGGASAEEESAWEASPEKLQQDTLQPLSDYIERLVGYDKTATPTQRMTILQVLLCKLIDVLDSANPFEVGPEYDLENNDEPRYLARDFRLTPLVALLTDAQKKWLVNQRFMMRVHPVDQQALVDWRARTVGMAPEEVKAYYRLAFPGFREDAHHDSTTGLLLKQVDREAKLGKAGFKGAFPPRQPRPRDKWWWAALNPEDVVKWREEAEKKGRTVVPPPSGLQQMASFKRGKEGSYTLKGASNGGGGGGGGGPLSWLRNRRRTASVQPEPESMDYALGLEEGSTRPDYRAAILTSPSQHTLRSSHPSMQSLAGESRKELADSQPAAPTAAPTSPPAATATALQPLDPQHSAEEHPHQRQHPHPHQYNQQQPQQRQQQSVLQPPPPAPPPLPEAEPFHLVTSIEEEMAALAAESSQPGQVPGAAPEAAKVRPTTPQDGAGSVRSSAGL
ncbi:hypothetical protein HYH03_010954 [Edaphochlamys debaryana]|uniref:Uncharacterized protein n=1 Tax=Edaphochlamys debaryana TaxID=47281 RepID=A0A835XVH0_9CHLO|nr:hypothetical protein HYH03_010954 [Edaphochlamys debaryana]|eukprot:KAG2490560.1 hypothetical protein HYH03_010954 [Edaphochlamys debaryana]